MIVALAIIALFLAATHIKRVEPGRVGVRIDYAVGAESQARTETLSAGYHIQWANQVISEYTTARQALSLTRTDGKDDSVRCQDRGGVPISIDVSAYWRIDPENAGNLFMLLPGVGVDDLGVGVVRRAVGNALSQACSRYHYDEIYGDKAVEFSRVATEIAASSLGESYLILDSLTIGEKHFQQAQLDAISAVDRARQSAREAMFGRIAAEEEAESMRIIQEQLAKSPLYLQYLLIRAWDGSFPLNLLVPQPKG